MKITKVSVFTGNENTMDIPCTNQQLVEYFLGKRLIQDIFPNLTSDQKEFLKTGVTPKEWENVFEKSF